MSGARSPHRDRPWPDNLVREFRGWSADKEGRARIWTEQREEQRILNEGRGYFLNSNGDYEKREVAGGGAASQAVLDLKGSGTRAATHEWPAIPPGLSEE